MMRNIRFSTLIAWIVLLFLFLPLFLIIITSFGTAATIQFPIQGFTIDWYIVAFRSETFRSSFLISFVLGILATLAALILGIPIAYVISRYSFRGKHTLNQIFLSPTIIPGVVIGYAIFQAVVVKLGLSVLPALVIGHTIISLPYIIRVIASSLIHFDVAIEEAAWTLGYTKLQTFVKILLPNLTSGIFAAFMLSFVNSFNNIPVSMFLSGPGVTTLPTAILNYMEFNYNPTVSAISTVLMLLTILLMFVIEKTLGLSSIM